MWIDVGCPEIWSLEDHPPSDAKRFTKWCLCGLVNNRRAWLIEKANKFKINTPKDAIDFVLKGFAYPHTLLGMPTDKHSYTAFYGWFKPFARVNFEVTEDYWQTAFETMMNYVLNKKVGKPGYGDCEDTAILMGGLFDILKVPYWVCFGMVYDGETPLGGHAFTIANLDGNWRLIETTLDTPYSYPDGWPEVDPEKNIYKFKDLKYEAFVQFNSTHTRDWGYDKKTNLGKNIEDYLKFRRKNKHSRKKIKRIKEVWGKYAPKT